MTFLLMNLQVVVHILKKSYLQSICSVIMYAILLSTLTYIQDKRYIFGTDKKELELY